VYASVIITGTAHRDSVSQARAIRSVRSAIAR
jgi:hypothetical protein